LAKEIKGFVISSWLVSSFCGSIIGTAGPEPCIQMSPVIRCWIRDLNLTQDLVLQEQAFAQLPQVITLAVQTLSWSKRITSVYRI